MRPVGLVHKKKGAVSVADLCYTFYVRDHNRNNKSILESLQRSVEAKEKERSDKLKNGFLLAITGMTLIETLYTALTNFFSRNMVYYSSVLIVLGAFLIYVVVKKHRE